MPTLTPKSPCFTRGRNHYDGQPLQLADSLTLARIQADDRAAFRAWIADVEKHNAEARAKLAQAAKEREEARRLAAPPLMIPSAISPERPGALTPDKKEKIKRAHLLRGANTREAARIAAESLTARKVFPSLPEAMQGLARQVSASTPLPSARPEDILSAWMLLEPNPLP